MSICKQALFFGAATMIAAALIYIPGGMAGEEDLIWQRGVSIYPRYANEFNDPDFKQSIHELAKLQVNFVTLVIPYYQKDVTAIEIRPGNDTPADGALIQAVKYIHSQNMKVMLKPHIEIEEWRWRSDIDPVDRDAWFDSYRKIIMHYAVMAENHEVEQISVGAELMSMTMPMYDSENTDRWLELIKDVRSVYGGKLTYSANWGGEEKHNEKNHIQFWDQLDFIGISAYFNLRGNDQPSLERAWHNWNLRDIKPLHDRYDIPILFTEIGYRNIRNSPYAPWEFELDGVSDENIQASAYEALFSYWSKQPFMAGVHIWKWEIDPEPDNIGYTVQDKKAESVIEKWFTDLARADKDLNNPEPPPLFVAEITTRTTLLTNTPRIIVTLHNQGGEAKNMWVGIFIRSKDLDETIEYRNQNFSSEATREYSFRWHYEYEGYHQIQVGVFSENWQTSYFWASPPPVIRIEYREKEDFWERMMFWQNSKKAILIRS